MNFTEEEREAAKKRKLERAMEATSTSTGEALPQQAKTAGAGTQQTVGSAPAPAATGIPAMYKTSGNAPAAATQVLAVKPKFLLVGEHFSKVLGMKVSTLQALAAALKIDVTGDSRPAMIEKIVHITGTCKSVISFDVDTDTFEFEDLEEQDLQKPAAQLV